MDNQTLMRKQEAYNTASAMLYQIGFHPQQAKLGIFGYFLDPVNVLEKAGLHNDSNIVDISYFFKTQFTSLDILEKDDQELLKKVISDIAACLSTTHLEELCSRCIEFSLRFDNKIMEITALKKVQSC